MRKKAMLMLIIVLLFGGIFFLTMHFQRNFSVHKISLPKHVNQSIHTIPIDLSSAQDPNLQKLALLQNEQKTYISNEVSLSYPLTNIFNDPISNADIFSQQLFNYRKFTLTPIVFLTIENMPEDHDTYIELQNQGSLNNLSLFLQQLKKDGVTDSMMGTWVFFPNANLISGTGSIPTPEGYTSLTNNYQATLANIFPHTERSILLASQTTASTNIPNGSSQTLLPYIQGIKPGLITSFGLQGFPWIQPMHTTNALPNLDPSIFLNDSLATNAAKLLHIKKIWFRTGTFTKMYTNNTSQIVTVPEQDRSLILQNIYEELQLSRMKGYQVSINMVIGNETSTKEAVDWSYSQNPQTFQTFLNTLKKNDFPLSLSLTGAILN